MVDSVRIVLGKVEDGERGRKVVHGVGKKR